MKANKGIKTLLLMGAVVLLGQCCKPDDEPTPPCDDPANPECPNYDPCYGVKEHNARFVIERKSWSGAPDSLAYSQSDGIYHFGILRFTALDSNATGYTWYLGAEVIHDQQFSRSFQPTDLPANTVVDVSLVTTFNPDTVCFPNATGRDSVHTTFLVVEVCDLKVDNTFRGVFAHQPEDTTDITISFFDSALNTCDGYLRTYNLGGAGLYNQPNAAVVSDTSIVFYNGSGSATPNGSLIVDPATDSMHMSIDYYSTHLYFDGKIVP